MADAENKNDDHADAHDISMAPFDLARYAVSLGLLVFSIVLVGALIFTENTRVAKEANPWVALIVCVSSGPGTGIAGVCCSMVAHSPADEASSTVAVFFSNLLR